ncbi:Nitrilase/cyanide hydratase and apolipoprotein N-acyltransferase [Thermaerobacter marianensis DSM 12885]|uniref:Nitrilase/cyanide hydratase and apolipoprotein N-acyltransferase n=1 Tax=Thermaerobacter marianensis (strain ATCC 700841 / DSM 12885 / JCM 10246 / 7p75a) TaxID=644966 RepID=E6SIL3_THEM7|nr:nitrilase-related carbon-nitrogen hydrolase [Thermaerobacter marianensis]ADU50919.1 Nitrilase/cyanide hydratase and apolipoprotein N-acyltransferase [Thermaerobacter marianensis DSM 12885]
MPGPLWQALEQHAFRLILRWTTRGGPLRRAVAALGVRRSTNLHRLDPARVRVAAVQLELQTFQRPEDFVRWVAEPLARAVEGGAQLVAFPEDVGLALLGLLPGFDRLAAAPSPEAALAGLGDVSVADVFRFLGPAVARVHHTTFSALARAHGVFVHAGSVMLPRGRNLYNFGFLYGPDGRLVGRHAKTHLLPLEAEWGVCPGDALEVYDTVLGKIGIPVCMDATYFETFRLLALKGAEMVVVPIANPEPYNEWHARRGTWARVQETPVYGIVPALVGRLLGIELTGRAAVYAPLELTPGGDGVVAQARRWDRADLVEAELDLVRLREYRQRTGFPGFLRPDLYDRYLAPAYRRLRDEPARPAAAAARRTGAS